MFFATYLRRELDRRTGQAVIIALGLALGVGLVVTVSAASAGVARAEPRVLGALYGVGTDVTVTGAARGVGQSPSEAPAPGAQHTEIPPDGTSSALGSPYSGISASKVAASRQHSVDLPVRGFRQPHGRGVLALPAAVTGHRHDRHSVVRQYRNSIDINHLAFRTVTTCPAQTAKQAFRKHQ